MSKKKKLLGKLIHIYGLLTRQSTKFMFSMERKFKILENLLLFQLGVFCASNEKLSLPC